jgi:hypothetical protein
VASINVVAPDGGNGDAGQIFVDHTGKTLYDMAYWGNQDANNTYEEFSIDQSNGKLAYLGIAGNDDQINGTLSFTGNDLFAFSSDCYKTFPSIYGFKRSSSGKLTELNINPPIPDAPEKGDWYCPWLAASDSFGHLAVPMQAFSVYKALFGPYALAVYTVSSTGDLTTTSTTENMPTANMGAITALSASPAGNLLAVAGTYGLQVFHFNGADPITPYTGMLTSTEVDEIFWDNDNHLYGISYDWNKLFVFTVTPTGYSQAPGSPYKVNGPLGLQGLPL